jgi:hypothetical protein
VLLKIVYVLTWRTLGLVVVFRGDRATVAEVLALRHENACWPEHANEPGQCSVGTESAVTSCGL